MLAQISVEAFDGGRSPYRSDGARRNTVTEFGGCKGIHAPQSGSEEARDKGITRTGRVDNISDPFRRNMKCGITTVDIATARAELDSDDMPGP